MERSDTCIILKSIQEEFYTCMSIFRMKLMDSLFNLKAFTLATNQGQDY